MHGGSGSVLAVTAQHPGDDDRWGTDDDLLAPMNAIPAHVSLDFTPGPDCHDRSDRVRTFIGGHPGLVVFAHADGSVTTLNESTDGQIYRQLSTISDGR